MNLKKKSKKKFQKNFFFLNFQKKIKKKIFKKKKFQKKISKKKFPIFFGKFLKETSNNNDIFENLSNKKKNFCVILCCVI